MILTMTREEARVAMLAAFTAKYPQHAEALTDPIVFIEFSQEDGKDKPVNVEATILK